MRFKFVALFVLVYLLSTISHLHDAIFEYNVIGNGAKCDGKTDNSNLSRSECMINWYYKWIIHNITSLDSKMFHINIQNCHNINLKSTTIDASIMSLNTDGIHIGRSNRVNIIGADTNIGDDCISLGDGSQHINIENVTRGLGHGISIGSLGKYHGEQRVVGITVRNYTLTNTANGVRGKTWPNSYKSIAYGLHFEDIMMNNVSNPIIIDQNYCPSNLCRTSVPSRVRISDVLFKDIQGTSAVDMAMQLRCGKSLPCQNVKLRDIGLKYVGMDKSVKNAISQRSNVKPSIMGRITRPACLTF
ncbi:hypothetical protein Cgig2_006591 [Carnegiea gigantea]|uniref:Polygalacturonase n=1 Tax=Carnegiea gigantea TaxID=171969 RepID=A0A9Q1KP36_9CARY|nr:hypothetical protein Cgig2_006591 [Carnegiea gigantea]